MLMALNSKEIVITADEATKSERYVCPGCQGKVILKKGTLKIAHFAHLKKVACASFSEGETEEHLIGKQELYEWFKKEGIEVELEAYIPELKQRPDLLVQLNGELVAIEYQCTPISVEIIKDRTEGYASEGIKVVWVIGQKIRMQRLLSHAQKAYLSQHKDNFYLFYYDFQLKELTVISDFQNTVKNLRYKVSKYRLHSSLNYLKKRLEQKKQSIVVSKPHSHVFKDRLYTMRYYKQNPAKSFFELLYEQQESIETLPSVLFQILPSEWMIQTFSYEWKYLFLLWLKKHAKQIVITQKVIKNYVDKRIQKEALRYCTMPNLSSDYPYIPYFEWIQELEKERIVVKISKNKWKVINKGDKL